eukprot:CAMPEP_0197468626 /NCGR_PEP_ID=MMETSP1175-20131217/66179_1 /TAXON_ID=1003142 /ORGANISM="Triceratium dubium, Strain CCMP147" /LENGTH=88 /DNA_ID=CAMNT_0043004729 /DNA_START=113 /DNA_END=379 /DNA_ORIENTATION=+
MARLLRCGKFSSGRHGQLSATTEGIVCAGGIDSEETLLPVRTSGRVDAVDVHPGLTVGMSYRVSEGVRKHGTEAALPFHVAVMHCLIH